MAILPRSDETDGRYHVRASEKHRQTMSQGGIHATRTFGLTPRIHPHQRRLRHRPGQCVALPLHHRAKRRRRLHHPVPHLPHRAGPAHHGHGVRHRPCQPEGHCGLLQRPGAQGHQVAHLQVVRPGRQLPADDVLHRGGRLVSELRREVRRRTAVEPGGRSERGHVPRHAGQPRRTHLMDGRGGRHRRRGVLRGRAQGRGERDQGHDDRHAGSHAGAGGRGPVPGRRRRRRSLLPGPGFRQALLQLLHLRIGGL